jgi:hypothetical protein
MFVAGCFCSDLLAAPWPEKEREKEGESREHYSCCTHAAFTVVTRTPTASKQVSKPIHTCSLIRCSTGCNLYLVAFDFLYNFAYVGIHQIYLKSLGIPTT